MIPASFCQYKSIALHTKFAAIFYSFMGIFMRDKLPFFFAAALIMFFGFRVLTPGHEYMMRPDLYLNMALDAGLIVGLIGTRSKMPAWLFWTALVCGLGLFGIRFLGDDQWWTGHLTYVLG
jgi:hypothetical protein